MHHVAEEIRRCKTLLDEHSVIRLYGRIDDQPYPSGPVVEPPVVEDQLLGAYNTPLIHYPLIETLEPPRKGRRSHSSRGRIGREEHVIS